MAFLSEGSLLPDRAWTSELYSVLVTNSCLRGTVSTFPKIPPDASLCQWSSMSKKSKRLLNPPIVKVSAIWNYQELSTNDV